MSNHLDCSQLKRPLANAPSAETSTVFKSSTRTLAVIFAFWATEVTTGCKSRGFNRITTDASGFGENRIPAHREYAIMETLEAKIRGVKPPASQWSPRTGVAFLYSSQNTGVLGERAPCAKEAEVTVLFDNPKGEARVNVAVDQNQVLQFPLKPVATAGEEAAYRRAHVTHPTGCLQGTKYTIEIERPGEGTALQLVDPAADYFEPEGELRSANSPSPLPFASVFWDTTAMKSKGSKFLPPPDLRGQHLYIAEVEVGSLAKKWLCPNGDSFVRGPASPRHTYAFVARCGVAKKLKEMGYNAVEFLPFTQSVDGDAWHLRYQTWGRAADSRFGTPDDFYAMVQSFNREGLLVIMDAVVGHFPATGNQGPRSLSQHGLARWLKVNGEGLFGHRQSPWNTLRYDYDNPFVRRHLLDSVLHVMKTYGVGGVRIDNYDGVHDYSPQGREFLKDLAREISALYPQSIFIGEIFFGHNKLYKGMQSYQGHGVHLRNHANFFDAAVKDALTLPSEQVDAHKIRDALRNPVDKWEEAARFFYITTHDEAGNKRDGATGAYPATLIKGDNPANWSYVESKTKAFGALAMLASPAYLDLPQARLLQEGTFGSNPEIQWELIEDSGASQYKVNSFFTALAKLTRDNAFAFQNYDSQVEFYTDYQNKIFVLRRKNYATEKVFYALVNLSHKDFPYYEFGIDEARPLSIELDSWRNTYTSSESPQPPELVLQNGSGLHEKPHRATIRRIQPYHVLVFGTQG